MSGKPITIVGEELFFRDSNDDRYSYKGDISENVELNGNFGILGDTLYYKDESGDVRSLPSVFISSSELKKGSLWISSDNSYLVFVDENNNKNVAHPDEAH